MYIQNENALDALKNTLDNKIVFIFDFDSTMVNTDNCYRTSWQNLLEKKGIKTTEGFIKMTKNSDDDKIYSRIKEYYDAEYTPEEKEERILNLIEDINKREPYRYVTDILNYLEHRPTRIMLLTDNKKRIIDSYLQHWGIDKYFHDVRALSNTEKLKEDIYRSIIMTNRPQSVLVFEDRQDYILKAKGHNFSTIGVEPENKSNVSEDTCEYIIKV